MSNDKVLEVEDGDLFTDLGGPVYIFSDRLPAERAFLALGRFGPGEGLRRHYHEAPGEEFYYVIRGVGKVWMGDDTMDVKAGDCLYVPPEVVHGVTNSGDDVLEVLFALAPKDKAAPIEP